MAHPIKDSSREQLRKLAEHIHSHLDGAPGLRPVAEGEGRRFAAHDLASQAEVAYGQTVDPHDLTDTQVEELSYRLDYPVQEHDRFRRRYWITHSNDVVGTVAIDGLPLNRHELQLSSLYLRPQWRAMGLGRATVDTIFQVAVAEGMGGVRLTADWLRPQSIHFYLHLGFQVTHWKHAIHMLRRGDAPSLRYRARGAERQLLVDIGGISHPLLTATCDGGWLRLEEHPLNGQLGLQGLKHHALSTMTVWLALEGFPLVRDAGRWGKAPNWSDGGEPEGLAYRIWYFEEYARRRGYRVDTPTWRLPGELTPPSWD